MCVSHFATLIIATKWDTPIITNKHNTGMASEALQLSFAMAIHIVAVGHGIQVNILVLHIVPKEVCGYSAYAHNTIFYGC